MRAVWFKSSLHRGGLTGELPVIVCLSFCGRNVSDGFQQPVVVEPRHPFEGRQLHRLPGQRAEEIYGTTILHVDDLKSEPVMKVLDALGSRYAERLGVSQGAILDLHLQMSATAEIFREQAVDSAKEEGKGLTRNERTGH